MKKYLRGWIVLAAVALASAEEVKLVTVTGDRVSLRAAPELSAVLLDRALLHDQLVLVDDSNPEWVGVRPPLEVDLWVHSSYLQDGVVLPALLNIRSGPSLSHGVVAIVSRDKKLTVRSELDDWMRIAPPEEAIVWISRHYTDMDSGAVPVESSKPADTNELALIADAETLPEKTPDVIISVESSEPGLAEVVDSEITEEETFRVVKTVLQPVINDVMAVASPPGEPSAALTPDPEKEQGVEGLFSGTLQPANSILYKLVDPTLDTVVVCYVRGNAEQMEAYAGRLLTLTGRTYWAKGLDQPLLVPEKIEVLSPAAVE